MPLPVDMGALFGQLNAAIAAATVAGAGAAATQAAARLVRVAIRKVHEVAAGAPAAAPLVAVAGDNRLKRRDPAALRGSRGSSKKARTARGGDAGGVKCAKLLPAPANGGAKKKPKALWAQLDAMPGAPASQLPAALPAAAPVAPRAPRAPGSAAFEPVYATQRAPGAVP
jgi:hypothetical protein